MKNKVKYKKHLLLITILSLLLVVLFLGLNIYEYKIYTLNYNIKIKELVKEIKYKYPLVNDDDIINVLNKKDDYNNIDLLKTYGIDLDKSIVKTNEEYYSKFLILNLAYLSITIILIIGIFIRYNKNKDKDLKDITKYIEEVNKKNYDLNIDSNSEDELSILKNEIYKTTVMLKEAADNSLADKKKLKEYLEDISHQLKTPLTSIYIMLDNIIDDPKMPKEVRNKFINQIKREVTNINFLVGNLLKLSKFDVNSISYNRDNYLIKDILKEAILNVTNLCDLKNIKIELKNNSEGKLYCDKLWQVEALTNILKNAIEHSYLNSKIDLIILENNVYLEIKISDFGKGMDKNDLKHIFERFYKGKNSTSESVGIGLSLAKAIIEKDNGKIEVDSKYLKGTTFTIKYFK